MNFSAIVPVSNVGAVNASLEPLYGPNNFSVPSKAVGSTMSDYAGLHCWDHPEFKAALETPEMVALGVVLTEGSGAPNYEEACTKSNIQWTPFDGTNASLPAKDATTTYKGKVWKNLVDKNAFAPPVNWREQGTNPAWSQPVGKEDAYAKDFSVTHKTKIWTSLLDYNTGEPGVSGWRETVATGYPAWVQPTGGHDAYKLNSKVSYQGKNWNNTGSDANVWAPGVFGWVTIA